MRALIDKWCKLEDLREAKARSRHDVKQAVVRGPGMVSLAGQKLYIDKAKVDVGDPASFKGLLRRHSCTEAGSRSSATMFVVDMEAIGQRIKWHCMAGLSCCDLSYVISNGERGLLTTYEDATRTRRHVWISDNFKAAHPELQAIIASLAARPDADWIIVGDKDKVNRSSDRSNNSIQINIKHCF